MITGKYPSLRLRRTRKYNWSRRLIQENNLSCSDLIYPIFLTEGKNKQQPIKSMPGVNRYSIDRLGKIVNNIIKYQIPMVALFPSTPNHKKDKFGTEAFNEDNLVCRATRYIKKRFKKFIDEGRLHLENYALVDNEKIKSTKFFIADDSGHSTLLPKLWLKQYSRDLTV